MPLQTPQKENQEPPEWAHRAGSDSLNPMLGPAWGLSYSTLAKSNGNESGRVTRTERRREGAVGEDTVVTQRGGRRQLPEAKENQIAVTEGPALPPYSSSPV